MSLSCSRLDMPERMTVTLGMRCRNRKAQAGETQVTDAAVFLLLQQVVQNAVLGIQVGVDVHLAHIVEQVKVKVVHPALLQLFLEDLLYLAHVAQIIAGEFVGQIELVPGIGGQSPADGQDRPRRCRSS